MNYPLFERPEGFYYSIALSNNWEDQLVRQLDLESIARSNLDKAEQTIFHFNQLGYSIREISGYYGANYHNLRRKMQTVLDRLAVYS